MQLPATLHSATDYHKVESMKVTVKYLLLSMLLASAQISPAFAAGSDTETLENLARSYVEA